MTTPAKTRSAKKPQPTLGWLKKLPEVGSPITRYAQREVETIEAMEAEERRHRERMAEMRESLDRLRKNAVLDVKQNGWGPTDILKAKEHATPHVADPVRLSNLTPWCSRCGADVSDPVHIA